MAIRNPRTNKADAFASAFLLFKALLHRRDQVFGVDGVAQCVGVRTCGQPLRVAGIEVHAVDDRRTVTEEQRKLTHIAKEIYAMSPYDGKYILNGDDLVICQSHSHSTLLKALYPKAVVNPLGDWTGGPDVDTGATNRKLGSDMGDSVTGGGLHGKDLSKADVSVNIYAWLKAQRTGYPVELCCAIGDETVGGIPYSEIVEIARAFIRFVGGFEKFAEWGLV